MYLRYSSSVVAPMHCSSPRTSAGLSTFEASMAPSAPPAPTSVCSSSMNKTVFFARRTSFITALIRSSNWPRYFVPATIIAKVEHDDALVAQAVRERCRRRPSARILRRWPSCRRRLHPAAPGCFSAAGRESESRVRSRASRPITGSSFALLGEFGEVAAKAVQSGGLALAGLLVPPARAFAGLRRLQARARAG